MMNLRGTPPPYASLSIKVAHTAGYRALVALRFVPTRRPCPPRLTPALTHPNRFLLPRRLQRVDGGGTEPMGCFQHAACISAAL